MSILTIHLLCDEEVSVKLVKKTPRDKFGEEFESEVLAESDDLENLKNKGWKFSGEKGGKHRMWVSEAVFGNKRLSEVNCWFMYLEDDSLLVIA